jgi:hypothetical protein
VSVTVRHFRELIGVEPGVALGEYPGVAGVRCILAPSPMCGRPGWWWAAAQVDPSSDDRDADVLLFCAWCAGDVLDARADIARALMRIVPIATSATSARPS